MLRFLDHKQLDTQTHTHAHAYSVELPWTNDQPVEKAATFTTHNKHKGRKSIGSSGFEPAILGIKLIQTYILERTTTRTNLYHHNTVKTYYTIICTFVSYVIRVAILLQSSGEEKYA
jgi:hypothetical protein